MITIQSTELRAILFAPRSAGRSEILLGRVRRADAQRLRSLFRVLFLNLQVSLDDCDVAIDGKVREALRRASRHRPLYFEPVDFFALADSQDDARIMGSEIASASHLCAGSF